MHYPAGRKFEPGFCTIDLWPDMTEYGADERFPTPFQHADGRTAEVFSPAHPRTVLRHFEWMEQYGIDGVFAQRFMNAGKSPAALLQMNTVLQNVRGSGGGDGADVGVDV
ncbi:MAG: hypothetical protein HC901_02280 [Bdellovibrionaceae bacterium]|nr:hypothetical protein [Pseudobdellovibrionaceae bacterium]